METSSRWRRAATGLVVALLATIGDRAHADEIAPGLEDVDLRAKTSIELRRLIAALPEGDEKRLGGAYVAFDPSVTDPRAQGACDDDGDYVVVVSDAMLTLASHIARAAAYEAANGLRRVESYATFIARSQIPGRRLLPPPRGFYAPTPEGPNLARNSYEEHLGGTLAFILAVELSHLRHDLTCPNPTRTKEQGDDVWTAAEQRSAEQIAKTVYASTGALEQASRDREAVASLVAVGHGTESGLPLLRFFAQLEVDNAVRRNAAPTSTDGGARMTFATLHPHASARIAVQRVAATTP